MLESAPPKQAEFDAGDGLQFGLSLNTAKLELRVLSPWWISGKVDGHNLQILASKGRVEFSVARNSQIPRGVYPVTFSETHPDGVHYLANIEGINLGQD